MSNESGKKHQRKEAKTKRKRPHGRPHPRIKGNRRRHQKHAENERKQKKKGGGGAGKKKAIDTFIRKEWYDIKAPATFDIVDVGKTIVNKTTGNRLAADSLRGRIFEASQGDLVTF